MWLLSQGNHAKEALSHLPNPVLSRHWTASESACWAPEDAQHAMTSDPRRNLPEGLGTLECPTSKVVSLGQRFLTGGSECQCHLIL